jgi:hypothetical protein
VERREDVRAVPHDIILAGVVLAIVMIVRLTDAFGGRDGEASTGG